MGFVFSKTSKSKFDQDELKLLPHNGNYSVGQFVKYFKILSPPVSSMHTRDIYKVVKHTEDFKFYSIEHIESGETHHDVPYFLLCRSFNDLYVTDFVKPGVRVLVNIPDQNLFHRRGRVVDVILCHDRFPTYSLVIDIGGNRTATAVPRDWRLDVDFYTRILNVATDVPRRPSAPHRNQQQRTREVTHQIIEAHVDKIVQRLRLEMIKHQVFNVCRLSIPEISSHFRRTLILDNDTFYEIQAEYSPIVLAGLVSEKLGFPYKLTQTGSEWFHVEHVKEYPSGLMDEIIERGLAPVANCGVGGGMFRELSSQYN